MLGFGITPITPADFMGRVEDYVKENVGLPADCCFLTLATDDQHIKIPPASRFVVITPMRFPPWQGVVSGASETGFDVAFRTTVFCRLTNDQELRASRILRDNTDGVLYTMFRVVQALQLWTMPVDENPELSYLREPMRISGSGPELVTKRQEANPWILCWINWEARVTCIQNPATLISAP